MNVLFYGITLFIVAFLVHFTIWKIRHPKHHTIVLLVIFFLTLLVGIVLFFMLNISICKSCTALKTACQALEVSSLFIALTLAYIPTYSALKADSPSLIMVMSIAKEGSKGLDKDVFMKKMNDDILVIPRIKDLIRSKAIYLDGDKFKLTTKGLSSVKLFIFYRNILKVEKGG
jgi:hypothetical protein